MKHAKPLLLSALCAAFAAIAATDAPQAASNKAEAIDLFKSEYDFRETPRDARPATDPAGIRRTGQMLLQYMRSLHYLHRPFDASMSPLAWTNFINSFDPQHLYFTAEDLAGFEPGRTGYAEMLASGDVAFARAVFDRFVERVAERSAFVDAALDAEYDYSEPDTYVWRRHDAPWPADRAEQDELWSRRVKNTLLAARVSCEIANGRLLGERAAGTSTNAPRDVAEAVQDARDDMRRNNERYLEVLRDSDEEMWLTRFFDAMATAYDPHSNYMSPALSEDFDIDMQLSLQGIGATLQIDDGAAKIVDIIPGSPAEHDESPEHLVRGDRIIAVAQGDEEFVDIRHWPLYKSVRLIRGPKGSTVRLRVIPVSDPDSTKIVTLVRDEIKLEEQAASSRLETFPDATGRERRVGYVKLPGFYASASGFGKGSHRSCTEDVARLIAELNAQDAEGLVLDLRGNGGGALQEAVRLAGLFFRTGPVVQVLKGGRRRPEVLSDRDPGIAFTKPLVVLTDRLSASASEIVAAALQDYGRAVVVGDVRTHGKGSVQTIVPLDGGRLGSLKPTTDLFFRITGGSTQVRGVEADLHLGSVFETYPDLGEDKLPNALPWRHIAPSVFRPVDSLAAVIPELRARSDARLATNEAWQARVRLLDNLAEFNSNSVVSLQYGTRLLRAHEDEEMHRRLRELSSDESSEAIAAFGPDAVAGDDDGEEDAAAARERRRRDRAERRPGADPVLDEALLVLVDLVDLHGPPASLSPDGSRESMEEDFLRSFFQ